MFLQYKPIYLADLLKDDSNVFHRNLDYINKENIKKRTFLMKSFRKYIDQIKIYGDWVFSNKSDIILSFKKNKKDKIIENRNYIIRLFEYHYQPHGISLFSHFFEGTNFSLVIKYSDKENISLYYGEFSNLFGHVLEFKENFPIIKDEVIEKHLYSYCYICGRSEEINNLIYCPDCSHYFCKECNYGISDILKPNHEWYFHRDKNIRAVVDKALNRKPFP